MVGTTRRSTRNMIQTSTPSDDGTVPNTPIDDNNDTTSGHGDYSSPQLIDPTSGRDDVSRLSQDLDPMTLDDGTASQKPDACGDGEIDPLRQDVKEVVAAMTRLEALGLQRQQISFPRCVILGQQSTGKSSVIEAISGIKTPRDTGTCTCCPLYITLTSPDDPSEKWHARVALRQFFDFDLQGGLERKYPGWIPIPLDQTRNIPFAETSNHSDLENLIRCAQSANLNPRENPASFLSASGPRKGKHTTRFSPNVVCIEISQPGLPTLAFYDLPGLISQAETDEEAYTVPLVQNLVAEYIKEKESLILVTCDLSNDIANSTAAGLARMHNATDRCIGVLTKPDRLQPGTPDAALINVLEGKRFQLGHKYFVVKNLDQEQIKRGLTHRDARIDESEFFASGRWATSLRHYQPRFGTYNLQVYLSKELAKQTLSNLPNIHKQIASGLQLVETELKTLPETPSHSAVRIIADVVLAFSTEVINEIAGEYNHTTWRNMWAVVQTAFDDSLVAMRPTLCAKGSLDKDIFSRTLPGKSVDDAMEVSSDDEEEAGGTRMPDLPQTPLKKRKLENATPGPSPFKTPTKPGIRPPSSTSTRRPGSLKPGGHSTIPQPTNFAQLKKTFSLDEVKKDVNENSYSKVPGQIHPKVRDAMMLSALQKWDTPTNLFFDSLQAQLVTYIGGIFEKHFKDWQGTEFYKNALSILSDIMLNNLNEQKTTMARETLHDELEGPYIFFKDRFSAEKDRVLERYRQHRQRVRFRTFAEEFEAYHGREMSDVETARIKRDERKMAIISQEPYAEEIELVATITSYYSIAARRLHDSVCMRVESKFFKSLRTQLRDELESGLGIYDDNLGPQTAQRLLAKSPEREMRRKQLLSEREALLEGLKCLGELEEKYHGSTRTMEGLSSNGLPLI